MEFGAVMAHKKYIIGTCRVVQLLKKMASLDLCL